MISAYLNQRVIWRRVTGRDFDGNPVTEDAEIPVRWEGHRRMVRDASGNQVVSGSRVFCTAPVAAGDLLVDASEAGKEYAVIDVATRPGLGGAEHHRELAL